MHWHKITLTPTQVVANEHLTIAKFFGDLVKHMQDDSSTGIALFTRNPPKGPCELFFSPEASNLAIDILEQYNAVTCEQPVNDTHLRFSSGDPGMIANLPKR